jgi:hypothetical protein
MNMLTLLISVTALAVSLLVSMRQIRLQGGAFSHTAMSQLWEKARDADFQEDMLFVLNDLKTFAPDAGISGLPVEIRRRVLNVSYLFQQYAYYVGLGIIDRDLLTHVLRGRIIVVWASIKPFVEVERTLDSANGEYLFLMLEHHAAYAKQIDAREANPTKRFKPKKPNFFVPNCAARQPARSPAVMAFDGHQ